MPAIQYSTALFRIVPTVRIKSDAAITVASFPARIVGRSTSGRDAGARDGDGHLLQDFLHDLCAAQPPEAHVGSHHQAVGEYRGREVLDVVRKDEFAPADAGKRLRA